MEKEVQADLAFHVSLLGYGIYSTSFHPVKWFVVEQDNREVNQETMVTQVKEEMVGIILLNS